MDFLSIPVKDPIIFFLFVFIPGFLFYYALSLMEYRSIRKSVFSRIKVFGGHWDALIWSIISGLGLNILVFLNNLLLDSSVPKSPFRETIDSGVTVLLMSLFAIILVSFFWESLEDRKIIGITVMILFTIIISPVIFLISELTADYLCSLNPMIAYQGSQNLVYSNTHLKSIKVGEKVYENVPGMDIYIINTKDYPAFFWIRGWYDEDKIIAYVLHNGSIEVLTRPQIIKSKEVFEVSFISEYTCAEKKEGWVKLYTEDGEIPLKYRC